MMTQHVAISPSEPADRRAIRELVEAHAYRAERPLCVDWIEGQSL